MREAVERDGADLDLRPERDAVQLDYALTVTVAADDSRAIARRFGVDDFRGAAPQS